MSNQLRWVLVLVNAACVIAGIALLSRSELDQYQLAGGLALLSFAAGQQTPQPRVSLPPAPPTPPAGTP